MKKQVHKKLEKARRLLQICKYSESLDQLKFIDSNKLNDIEKEEYYLLKSESLLFLGEYQHNYLDDAIELLKSSINHDKYAQAKYLKVNVGQEPCAPAY